MLLVSELSWGASLRSAPPQKLTPLVYVSRALKDELLDSPVGTVRRSLPFVVRTARSVFTDLCGYAARFCCHSILMSTDVMVIVEAPVSS